MVFITFDKFYCFSQFSRLTETTVDDIIQQLPEIRHLSLVISNYHVERMIIDNNYFTEIVLPLYIVYYNITNEN